MFIGMFRAIDDGFVGNIVTLSFGRVPVVMIPDAKQPFSYDVLSGNGDDSATIKFGTATRRVGTTGNYLKIRLDCPGLAAPIDATMSLKPSREGIYSLTWVRNPRHKKD